MVYLHKSESVQNNETHKIIWIFKIHLSKWIPVRKPDAAQYHIRKTLYSEYNQHILNFDDKC